MEYLLVTFPRSRRVKVDDEFNGRTGEVIELEAGSHVISLGPPPNFTPGERRISLKGTSELDPQEISFDYEDASAFEDLESREQIPVVPQSFRDQYRSLIQEHISALRTKFSEQRIDYAVINTSEPLDHALFSYLSSREKLMRVR